MRPENIAKGNVSEISVVSELTRSGLVVSETRGQAPYDLVVDHPDDGLIRVQVKSIRESKRGLMAYLERSGSDADGYYHEPYTENEIDAFAVYNHIHDEVYWMWVSEAPKTKANRSLETWRESLISEKI